MLSLSLVPAPCRARVLPLLALFAGRWWPPVARWWWGVPRVRMPPFCLRACRCRRCGVSRPSVLAPALPVLGAGPQRPPSAATRPPAGGWSGWPVAPCLCRFVRGLRRGLRRWFPPPRRGVWCFSVRPCRVVPPSPVGLPWVAVCRSLGFPWGFQVGFCLRLVPVFGCLLMVPARGFLRGFGGLLSWLFLYKFASDFLFVP